MEVENLRRSFWVYLHSQGFPQSINDEILHLACLEIESQVYRGKRLILKNWSLCFGGLHTDDVALAWLLAKELGLKQGLDWDWGLEYDNYHLETAYVDGDNRVKKLLRLSDLYYVESHIFMNVKLRLFAEDSIEDSEVERLFSEERAKIRELKQAFMQKALSTINLKKFDKEWILPW